MRLLKTCSPLSLIAMGTLLFTQAFCQPMANPAGTPQGPTLPAAPATFELDAKGKRAHIDFNVPARSISEANLKFPQFSGRKLLVFYFSAKCPHCQHAYPHVQKVADSLAPKGFTAVAMAVKFNTDEDILGFIRDFSVRMPVFQDDQRLFGEYYGTGSIPLILLINPKGEYIRYKEFDPTITPEQIIKDGGMMAKVKP